MRNVLKCALIASVAGLALAEPALAQSFNPEFGTANTLALTVAARDTQSQAAQYDGRDAFARAPERGISAQRDTGTPSVGYETLLATH
jgi:hypothetical protein